MKTVEGASTAAVESELLSTPAFLPDKLTPVFLRKVAMIDLAVFFVSYCM